MIITYLRSSSYGTHEVCRRQYLIKYVLGWPDDGNLAAHKGSIIHKVLEALALVNLARKEGKNSINDGEVYNDLDLNLCEPDLLTELSFAHYQKLYPMFQWNGHLDECKKWVDKAINYQNGAFDPRNLKIISPEVHFDVVIEKDWAKYEYELRGEKISGYLGLKGTIDNVIDGGPDTIEILDWKSGQRKNWSTGKKKQLEDFQHDPQMLMYVYSIYKMYPNIKQIVFTILYINDGGAYTIPFSRDRMRDAEELLRKKFQEIRDDNIAPLTEDKNKCQWLCKFGSKGKRVNGMSICNYIDNEMQLYGIDYVVKNHMKEGFNPSKYGSGGGQQNRDKSK